MLMVRQTIEKPEFTFSDVTRMYISEDGSYGPFYADKTYLADMPDSADLAEDDDDESVGSSDEMSQWGLDGPPADDDEDEEGEDSEDEDC